MDAKFGLSYEEKSTNCEFGKKDIEENIWASQNWR
jgi:hypothetical protein